MVGKKELPYSSRLRGRCSTAHVVLELTGQRTTRLSDTLPRVIIYVRRADELHSGRKYKIAIAFLCTGSWGAFGLDGLLA